SSLARLLVAQRGVRHRSFLPPLTRKQILAWADAHYRRAGGWPITESGPIPEAAGETWASVNQALLLGTRGLLGGSSLAKLLAEQRGRKHVLDQPRLSYKKIVAWADAHCRRTGAYPNINSGV